MLRTILTVAAGLALVASLAASIAANQILWGPALFSALLFAATLFEHHRYKRLSGEAPGRGWEPTGEQFVDPETGLQVQVYFHPATGERRYVSQRR